MTNISTSLMTTFLDDKDFIQLDVEPSLRSEKSHQAALDYLNGRCKGLGPHSCILHGRFYTRRIEPEIKADYPRYCSPRQTLVVSMPRSLAYSGLRRGKIGKQSGTQGPGPESEVGEKDLTITKKKLGIIWKSLLSKEMRSPLPPSFARTLLDPISSSFGITPLPEARLSAASS
ncbi:hypothetical protein Daesc_008385 [Daldinia eschscholtzii]|uniref:Uncharacterized protein n=1 Tax=Daldinia eschscholtzii TaxID=292717 RepID=A0AAX6MCY9_9PEZI